MIPPPKNSNFEDTNSVPPSTSMHIKLDSNPKDNEMIPSSKANNLEPKKNKKNLIDRRRGSIPPSLERKLNSLIDSVNINIQTNQMIMLMFLISNKNINKMVENQGKIIENFRKQIEQEGNLINNKSEIGGMLIKEKENNFEIIQKGKYNPDI